METFKRLDNLFQEQVERTPDKIAVVFQDRQLTYQELNQRSNQLANYLRSLSVKPEVLVGICLERSLLMIVGLLAILKAGGAYVPLDPNYPKERLAYMFSDAQMPILLTTSELVAELPENQAQVICLDTDWGNIAQQSKEDLQNEATAENLAYVLYTSGSTGKPKGVCCHHQGVVNLLEDFEQKKPLCLGDRCSWWTSLSFDVSVYEIFSPLLVGGTLHIVPESLRYEAIAFFQWLDEHQISSAYMPPFMLNDFAEWLKQNSHNCALQRLLVGVEPIIEQLLVTITQQIPDLQIINGYGPTEATICATLYPVSPDSTHDNNTPIGKPVQNTEIYLLDSQLKPVPANVSGEIYIGGIGLARGYLNRPELTAEKFIANPFKNSQFKRLYQTGDLARYLDDGNIEFLGRIDHQVKIRGFRSIGQILDPRIAMR